MNAYFNNKDKNKLIVTNMIDENEKEELLSFINKLQTNTLSTQTLYDAEGNIAGVQFCIDNVGG